MAVFKDQLDDTLQTFIAEQKVFFVASAAAASRVNLSPKGMDTLRVLSTRQVAYLDIVGSGNETAAHLLADGRLTMMFCSFGARPLILRLYGKGRVVRSGDSDWEGLRPHFPDYSGVRQIIVLDVDTVQTSCGFGVPVMQFLGERPDLERWAAAKGEDGVARYVRQRNATSIDGLPTGLEDDDA